MPKPRGRRPEKPNQPIENNISKNTPTKEGNKETNIQTPVSTRLRPLNIWKDVWAILGPAVATTGLAFLLWPKITIEPSANSNPTDALGTEFVVTNSGNIPIYNVRFRCGMRGASLYFGDVRVDTKSLSPVQILSPEDRVARSCVISSEGSEIPNLQITATFKWPLIPAEGSKSAFFRVIRGTNGTAYLVPDLAPH